MNVHESHVCTAFAAGQTLFVAIWNLLLPDKITFILFLWLPQTFVVLLKLPFVPPRALFSQYFSSVLLQPDQNDHSGLGATERLALVRNLSAASKMPFSSAALGGS